MKGLALLTEESVLTVTCTVPAAVMYEAGTVVQTVAESTHVGRASRLSPRRSSSPR